jgi:hypothetical protein
MKRNTIVQTCAAKTFAIAALAVLSLSIAPTAKAADKGCSNFTLQGTFSRHDTGTILAPAAIAGPYALVGTFTFDGNGGVTGATTASQNGTIGHGTQTGTYTVNPDCTGTIVVHGSAGFSSHYSFVIDDSGNEFQYICTDSNPISIVYTGVAHRQFPQTDWRQ